MISFSFLWKTKPLNYLFTALLFTLISIYGCNEEDEEPISEPTNSVPTVEITNPVDGDTCMVGDTIEIIAELYDAEEDVVSVYLKINGENVVIHDDPPYNYEWIPKNSNLGDNYIEVFAYDKYWNAAQDSVKISLTIRIEQGDGLTDIEGNQYSSIIIHDQEWMAENFRGTRYNDGEQIIKVEDNEEWNSCADGYYCWYNNDSASYAETYGALYNWRAVYTGKLCPEGWHLPTIWEREDLLIALGKPDNNENPIGWSGTNQGSKLAGMATLWSDGALKNDAEFGVSNFMALPAGRRNSYGEFIDMGQRAYWWLYYHDFTAGDYWSLEYDKTQVYYSGGRWREPGISLRCLKD